MPLTAEDLKAVADSAKEAAKTAIAEEKENEAKKVNTKFTPGAGEEKAYSTTQVLKDESDQPFANLGEFLQSVRKAGPEGVTIREPRLKRCVEKALDPRTKAPTGMGETVPSDGAFLVAQEFIPTLITRLYNTGIVFSKCFKQPVGPNFNGVKIPAIDETSRADGSRWGGVQGYWAAEGATVTTSKPKIRQISMELEKLFALCYVTDELLEDSVALENHVMTWFPLEIGFKLDDAIVNGDGVGKPLGILNSPAILSVSKETGQLATTIVTANILKMFKRFWPPSWPNAIWLINQDTLDQLMTLTIPIGTAGAMAGLYAGNVYVPPGLQAPGIAVGTGNAAAYGTILGRPVIPIEQCQTLGTIGDIILFDPSQYMVIEKGGLNAATSIHVQFVTDQTAFRFTYRCNGQTVWHSVLTPFKGSSTVSPYVALATRS